MRIRLLIPVIVIALAVLQTASIFAQTKNASEQALKSVYTDLNKKCRSVEETHLDFVRRCPGVAGYDLLVGLYDERFDITVISPGKKEFDLNFLDLITRSFSDPGGKAEWRVKQVNGKTVPVALIVRVNAQENADTSAKITPYLAVSKITNQGICLTDKIMPGPGQNEEARLAADKSWNRPCLK